MGAGDMNEVTSAMTEEEVRNAIIGELQRQAEIAPDRLKVAVEEENLNINGPINLDELVMAIVGSLAGGP